MRKFRAIFWGIKTGFSYCPFMFICYLGLTILLSTVSVYSTVLLGDTISEVQILIEDGGAFSTIFQKLILFGILEVALWLLLELRWRFSDDIMPMRTNIAATKRLIKFSQNIPLRYYDKKQFCDEYKRYREGVKNLAGFVRSIVGAITGIYRFVLIFVSLWQFNFIFSLILTVFCFINYFATKNMPEIQNEARMKSTQFERLVSYYGGMFSGTNNRETRLFGLKDYYKEQWLKNKEELCAIDADITKRLQRNDAIPSFLRDGVCPLIIICLAIGLVFMKRLAVGSIYTAWQLSNNALSNASSTISNIIGVFSVAKHIEESYNFEKKILAEAPQEKVSSLCAQYDCPAISIENVEFAYLDDKIILKDVSLNIKKGEIVALLGENGSGKSTLIKLILGLYKPNKGRVRIFGQDTYMEHDYVSNHVGVTFQDFCTYPFTLRENIAFGNIEKINDDIAIERAAKTAQADAVLSKAGTLDRMLGRKIDSDGIELSGGEWQRVALARAYLGDRDIMIFDEPAAKLDPLTEVQQFETIRDYAKDKSVILVSHRVGFARLADKIVMLKDGKIIEAGSHEELYEKQGEYYKMFMTQKELYTAKEESV